MAPGDDFEIKGAAERQERQRRSSEASHVDEGAERAVESPAERQRRPSVASQATRTSERSLEEKKPKSEAFFRCGSDKIFTVRARTPSEDGEERDDRDPYSDDPPLPDEPPPQPDDSLQDDGWEYRFDAATGTCWYFNRFTGLSQWENPRVPAAPVVAGVADYGAPGTIGYGNASASTSQSTAPKAPPQNYGGYNPKIHGNFDPNADYAKWHAEPQQEEGEAHNMAGQDNMGAYEQQGKFNRFTGAFQSADRGAEYHNDENKSNRQMNAFFDVDRAANSHDGRSLREERQQRKLSSKQVKKFNETRRAKKEKKRRDFLMS